MHKPIGLVLLLCSLPAFGMAFLAFTASADAAEKHLRQTPELYAVCDAANAARLARTCSEIGIAPPAGFDPDSIERWLARAQHEKVVQRMTRPHVYGWPATGLVMLACGVVMMIAPPRSAR